MENQMTIQEVQDKLDNVTKTFREYMVEVKSLEEVSDAYKIQCDTMAKEKAVNDKERKFLYDKFERIKEIIDGSHNAVMKYEDIKKEIMGTV